jgi:type IV pilus assembly protein PilC
MLFSRQLPLATLLELCHVLRVNLDAGLMLRDVFRQLAGRGSARLRPLAARIHARLDKGDSLRAVLKQEKAVLPPRFRAMAGVGEQTGRLPEVLKELEAYYQLQLKYWRQLRARSLVPVVQFVIAIGVVALLVFLLGAIAQARGAQAQGVLGFQGTAGAIRFLLVNAALFGGIYLAYRLVTRVLGQQAAVDSLLLRLPGIGPCLQALVIGRFALAMQMTLDTALPLGKALRLSLEATGNAAFARQGDAIIGAVEEGEDLTVALGRGRLFPLDFLGMVAVAEEGGRVVEIMRHQASYYHQEAGRRMQALTRSATGLIWLVYVVFMVVAIFQVAGIYFGALGGR